MHDCRKTKKNLVNLVFGELEADQQQGALADVRSCPVCSEEYHSMLATLRVFNQAVEAAMPEESYWAGYESQLRARLAEPTARNFQERLAEWFAGQFAWVMAKPAIPITVFAGLILLAAISAAWFSQQKSGNPPVLAVNTTPTPQPASTVEISEKPGASQEKIQPEPLQVVAIKKPRQRRPRPVEQSNNPMRPMRNDLIVAASPSPGPSQGMTPSVPVVTDPASHLEKAQLLLRSFRNARVEDKGAGSNLAYEKQQARKLVYDNILLRREAESKGYLPVEEALNSLEPLLMDIANLPNKASRGEVQVIRKRIQDQEIIATLQIVSSGTERFPTARAVEPIMNF